jgi:stage II sporulation protein E
MPIKINLKTLALYAVYAIILLCINATIKGVPFSIGLYFAMLICGANIVICPLIYILAGIINLSWITSLLNLFEGAFLCAVTLIYRKAGKKLRLEAAVYIVIALAPFIAFSPWQGEAYLPFLQNCYIARACATVAIVIFCFFCTKSVYALFFRLCRCALQSQEILCLSVVFITAFIGLYNIVGLYPFLSISAGLTIFAVRFFKNPSAILVACILSIPIYLSTLNTNYVAILILFCAVILLFASAGRGAASGAGLTLCTLFFYFDGAFSGEIYLIILRALIVLVCCLIPTLATDNFLDNLHGAVTVKAVIPKVLEGAHRQLISEKLFKISQAFREIECAFSQAEESIDEQSMKYSMLCDLKEKCCSACERREKCAKSQVYSGFSRLIDCGCIKGKVNLVDLPESITTNCARPTDVIAQLNKLLADYRRFTLEAENMKSGRKLLANQAKGVSEVLKDIAAEFSRMGQSRDDLNQKIARRLAEIGVKCSEIKTCDEDIYITCLGKVKYNLVTQVLREICGKRYILKDKIVYDNLNSCLIFTCPPKFDAAFGVAFAIKDGEKLSGDTHSVIKINEHSFLMVLSDGMGSGEYAKQVSSTAISLIEAFYRAEMPTDTVLDTINKLICFSRDERFTCIDIARIDLNSLEGAFIKIGSPAGAIVRQGEIKVLESDSLPLGILELIKPKVCKEQLKADDMVVFMSDGITSAFPSATDLYEFLGSIKALNPQNLADKILERALELAGTATDDMTVICTRIFKRDD